MKLYDDRKEIFEGSKQDCVRWAQYILSSIKDPDSRGDMWAELYIEDEYGVTYDADGDEL